MSNAYWRNGHIEVRYRRADGSRGNKARNPVTRARWTSTDEAEAWGDRQELLAELGVTETDEAEVEVAPAPKEMTVGEFFATWWPHQELSLRSDGNYRYLFEAFVLPEFGHLLLSDITALMVQEWEQRLAKVYQRGGVPSGARARLSTLLGDAVLEGLIDANPALKQKRRGRRSGAMAATRAEEKVWATAVQALLHAERCGVISGRDDEFIFDLTIAYGALRWGEGAGLEVARVGNGWMDIRGPSGQLVETSGGFFPGPPKDDSHRTVHTPPFLTALLARQKRRMDGVRCNCKPKKAKHGRPEQPCQGGRYMFLGPRLVEDLQGVRYGAHLRNSNYARDVFDPAAEGWWPEQRQRHRPRRPRRPIMVDLGPGQIWPGTPWRPAWPAAEPGKEFVWSWRPGQRAWDKDDERFAVASWLPLVPGLTPHGLRHSQSTWLEDLGIGRKYRDYRMGHANKDAESSSMWARYTHVSDEMVLRTLDGLQRLWETSLAMRAAISLHSPVAALDELLAPFRDGDRQPLPVDRRGQVIQWRDRRLASVA
jgi:integrase